MSITETIPSQKRLYLGRLPYGAVQKDIENFLRGYGHIERLVLKRGYAFVELDNARDAEDAVRDLNGRVMEKMNVVVDFAQTPLNWTTNYRDSSPSPMRLHSPMPVRSPSHDRDRVRRSPKAAEWYKDIHGAGSPSRDHAHRSPRAAEWYRDVYAPRENYHGGAGSPPGGGGGRGDTRIVVDEERRRIRRISRSPVRTRRPPPRYMRSRSRSPLLSSGTGIGGSSQHSHLPNLDDDGMDEYEEVDEGEYFFRLLDGRAELEAIAKEFTLEINIRTFDCSVAFGRTIPISNSKKVKEEPGAAGSSSSSSSNAGANKLDKWIVFADRGPVVRVSNYEGTTLVKEHNVPKFEWEPFLGAIRGMCEKYLLGK